MGFRFRKQIKMGPVRVTLSKAGVGTSIGAAGMRFTRKASGKTQTTYSVPGTGMSYVSGESKPAKHEFSTVLLGIIVVILILGAIAALFL